jgi:misacylated tRNA(Ala) deacylase
MTEKLYWKDAYLKEFKAKIMEIDGNFIILDKTVFYPTGGGQPCDTGKLIFKNLETKIIETKKREEEILHISENVLDAPIGEEVTGIIDWKRRYMHMRYHTAVHIIDGIISKMEGHTGFSTGSQIYSDRARIDVDMPSLNKELGEEIIKKSNLIINENHKIIARELEKNEALKIPNLSRTAPGRELINKLDFVRVIDIENFDMQADGGTHVASTKEVGMISLIKLENKGKHSKRMEIVLG